jgi:hypothetical protein
MNAYTCTQCGYPCELSTWVLSRWENPTADRCRHCGMVHCVQRGHPAVAISPPMLPYGVGGRTSPWMLPWTRPVSAGLYECRFGGGNRIILLFWNGKRFTYQEQPVAMTTFTSWRGTWK